MRFKNDAAEVFVTDGIAEQDAFSRTTHLAVGAHPDDLEMMAIDGILECFGCSDKWFTGVVVTDGAGSPRAGAYSGFSDDDMRRVRAAEQKQASVIGGYSAQVLLGYPSAAVLDRRSLDAVDDLVQVFEAVHPEVVYTHNLMDAHSTHIAVALRVLQALRQLPKQARPGKVYGCEVWRSLDWLQDEDKVTFDCSGRPHLQQVLLGVFDSQISGGKRYDKATIGRRVANATFLNSHRTEQVTGAAFAMDLTPLVEDGSLKIGEYVTGFIDRFRRDVLGTIKELAV